MSRRKIGGMTLGVGHSTNNEFFSNNNVLLKKMVDNQWNQAVALSNSLPNTQVLMNLNPTTSNSSGGNNNSSQLFVGNFNPNNQ